jgi:hypothetical protein
MSHPRKGVERKGVERKIKAAATRVRKARSPRN